MFLFTSFCRSEPKGVVENFFRLPSLPNPGPDVFFPDDMEQYLVTLAFNRACELEGSDDPETALLWIEKIQNLISGVQKNETRSQSIVKASLKPAFVDTLIQRLQEAEDDLRGEINVRVDAVAG